ncbi:YitT family protein, partial [Xanthomonas hortorum]
CACNPGISHGKRQKWPNSEDPNATLRNDATFRALRPRYSDLPLKTFAAVGACGALTDLIPRWAEYAHISTLFSAIVGGALAGLGILFFIRHRGSLGGIGILAVYLQRERGWSAGKVQMSFDAMLMLVAFTILTPDKVLYSALGALMLSLVLMFNHRPHRYMGV